MLLGTFANTVVDEAPSLPLLVRDFFTLANGVFTSSYDDPIWERISSSGNRGSIESGEYRPNYSTSNHWRHLRFKFNTAGSPSDDRYNNTGILSSLSNIEITGRLRIHTINEPTSGFCVVGVGFRLAGALTDTGTPTGYIIGLAGRDASPNCRLWSVASGTLTVLASKTLSISGSAWVRFRIQAEGTTFRVKWWLDSTTEPASWDATLTDSHASSGGLSVSRWLRNSVEAIDDLEIHQL